MTGTDAETRLRGLVERFAEDAETSQIDFMEAHKAGRKIIGVYCGYIPCELIRAAGGIPVSLCGNDVDAIPPAEIDLPRNFCPLIKSSYGLAITDTCPYFHFSDALIGETTCDGKKKVFELLADLKPVYVMQLPFNVNDRDAMDRWREEIAKVSEFIEDVVGSPVDIDALRSEIARTNRQRLLLKEITSVFALDDPPITWTQMLQVLGAGDFLVDEHTYTEALEEFKTALDEAVLAGVSAVPKGAPRVLITGTPLSMWTNKVMRLAEESGAAVVAHDACSGTKGFDRLIDEGLEPYEALAQYTLHIPCACMSPNEGRIDLMRRQVEEYRIDGVIDTVWQGCHTFNVESVHVARAARDLGLPYLKIETDYSEQDTGQLQTRIEAFVEQMA